MIIELLMFLLLFQDSKAGNINDSINSFEESCITDGGKFLDDNWKRICIPREYLGILLDNPDFGSEDEKTNIEVVVSKLQIIKIGDDTITLSMGIGMRWFENRLKVNMHALQLISLRKKYHDQIWSPQIVIKNNMVSRSKEGEQFWLIGGKDDENLGTGLEAIEALKKFYLRHHS